MSMVTDDGEDTSIKDIFNWNEQSTVFWATAQGLYPMNTHTATSTMIYRFSQVTPTG